MSPGRHGLAHLAFAAGLWLAATPLPLRADPVAFDLDVAGGRVALRIGDPVPLADVVAALARAIGAEAVIRRDPGEIGPLAFAGLTPGEALQRLAGRSSLAVTYGKGGEVRSIVLVARDGRAGETRVAAAPPRAAAPPETPRNRQSKALRRIVELSYRTDDTARAELLTLAANAEPPIRRAAISALATLGGPAAASAIGSRGLADSDPSVRRQAAHSLWQLMGRAAGPRLAAAAAIDPDPQVRTAIAELLRPAP